MAHSFFKKSTLSVFGGVLVLATFTYAVGDQPQGAEEQQGVAQQQHVPVQHRNRDGAIAEAQNALATSQAEVAALAQHAVQDREFFRRHVMVAARWLGLACAHMTLDAQKPALSHEDHQAIAGFMMQAAATADQINGMLAIQRQQGTGWFADAQHEAQRMEYHGRLVMDAGGEKHVDLIVTSADGCRLLLGGEGGQNWLDVPGDAAKLQALQAFFLNA